MSNIKETVEAVQGIVEAVPVYEDLLQPASKELGKGLLTVSKAVNIALTPVSALVWGYEKIAKYLEDSIAKKVPRENIQTPDPTIAVPAVEALRYSAHNEDLREMFSSLIATAMDKTKAFSAHPSFVQTIKQINSDEAKILKLIIDDENIPIIEYRGLTAENKNHFATLIKDFSLLPYQAGCDFPNLGPSYLVNLARLGLISIDYTIYNITPNIYDLLTNHPVVKAIEASYPDFEPQIKQGVAKQTKYGKLFYEACISPK
jgi:hypothetical protein